MVLTLDIRKDGPGEYLATLSAGGQPVADDLGPYRSIADAIQATAKTIPTGFAAFVEPRFAGISAGTLSVAEAATVATAEASAQRMIRVLAALKDELDH